MHCVNVNLGVSTADAEDVGLQYARGTLRLSFRDWQDAVEELVFNDVLAFRWQEFDETGIRDDETYEVLDSEWLRRQAALQAEQADGYAHYKLCFNAAGVLDILARRTEGTGSAAGSSSE